MMIEDNKQQREELRRWRLILGKEPDGTGCQLSKTDRDMDAALEALYGDKGGFAKSYSRRSGSGKPREDNNRQASKEESQPTIARWLGDIRSYFPTSVVQVMQRDAIDRFDHRELLLEPELLDIIRPDVHLVADLLSLSKAMPSKTRDSARIVVQKLVDEIKPRLQHAMHQAVRGALNRAVRNFRPRHNEINWHQTIRRNLKHYQPDLNTIIAETLVGYGRKRAALKEIILCVDQSGSMGASVVYSGIFGAVLASLPSLKTHMVVYDTSVVDLTEDLNDPVDLLFGTQLGGGNDGPRALAYCERLITRPADTVFVLISDLYENDPDERKMLGQITRMKAAGVQFVVLLALSDSGTPSYKRSFAESLGKMDIPAFACTPDLFPDLIAAALNRQDIRQWTARNEVVTRG